MVGPIVEELYFRGYLLRRMSRWGKWAPLVNALFVTLYHFWQPHNYVGIFFVSFVLAYAVWKTQNLMVGIFIHCTLNLLGAVSLLGMAQL